MILTDSGAAVAAVPASNPTVIVPVPPMHHAVVATSSTSLGARKRAISRRRRSIVAAQNPSLGEPFSEPTTSPNLWAFTGDACLTAGPAPTATPVPSPAPTTGPPSTIPSCGTAATVDAPGSGTLELTPASAGQQGSVLYRTPFETANGLQVVFTDYAFQNTTAQGDGVSLFVTDASQALPSPVANASLAYIGMPGAYLGIGFDEYGNFSAYNGGTLVPNSIALRGTTALGNPYLGGYTVNGAASSLPFQISQNATNRPATAPTFRVTIMPTGEVIVEADIHDGNGFVQYLDQQTVGVQKQTALPAQVYLGLGSETGDDTNVHEIGNLSVSYLTPSSAAFAPSQIANLSAWYDASDPTTLAKVGGLVSTWADKSGSGNDVTQSATSAMPSTGSNLDGLGALQFEGRQFLSSANALFSSNLFDESTVFVVANQANILQSSSLVSTGVASSPSGAAANAGPLYDLQLSDGGKTNFDFNNASAGRLSVSTQPSGPGLWTATGDLSGNTQTIRKNGLTIASSTGPGAAATALLPLLIGADRTKRGTGLFYTGQIGEVLVYDSALTATDTASVEGYLACKWGMQNLLPANHPYAHVCPNGIVASGVANVSNPVPSGTIVAPAQLVSANGFLTLNLTAAADASGNPHLTYNGSTTAPTLRLLPGDVLTVNLTNTLPTPPAGSNYLNDTNLHFHGLHVSPNAPSDDSIDLLALPGQSLQYKIAIPANHPPGLYWYHSHAHGEVERQNLSGMSGALVIDGIAAYTPAVANMREQILIARDAEPTGVPLPAANSRQIAAMYWAMQHANTAKAKRGGAMPGLRMGSTLRTMTMGDALVVRGRTTNATRNPYVTFDTHYKTINRKRFDTDTHCVTGSTETASKTLTLNGAINPSINIAPGEQQFWRVVNAGSDTYLDLALDNATMQVIGIDGVPISSGVNTPSSLTVNDYVLPPASRVEMIVTGPAAGTQSYLRTKCFDAGTTGPAMPATTLASINSTPSTVSGGPPNKRIPPRTRQYRFASGKRRTAIVVSRTQTLTYDDQNNIDGIAYDPASPAKYYAQSGTYEEWTINNTSSQVHTFHIHQVHFVLEAIDGVTQTQQYVMDNVNVPAATANGPGSVKLLLDFTDPTIIGTFLLHCHILSHEDQGMMAKIRIGTAPPFSTSATSLTFASPTAAAQNLTISGGLAPYSVAGCTNVATGVVNSGMTAVAVTPSGAGQCVLSITDSSGQTSNVSVNVNAAAPALTVSPTTIGFASSKAAQQTDAITGGVPPYTVSIGSCNGIVTAAIDGTTTTQVDINPASVGSCALQVADSASTPNTASIQVSVNGSSGASPADNVTFHHDAGRTGWYSNETTLTAANVSGGTFKLLTTLTPASVANGTTFPAFGKVMAQPLYASAETINGVAHNLVIIATETDQVYAIDDKTDKVVWERNFTNGGTITQQSYNDTKCDDVNPDIGITSTPVIDRSSDTMYVVVATDESGTSHMRLHAISLQTGADTITAQEINPSYALATGGTASVSPVNNFSRSALLEANGNIYVALGSHCDYGSGTVHGWLISYSASTLAINGSGVDLTNADPGNTSFLGSVWMSGYGPAADANGNVYVATGNGPYDGKSDFGMSDLEFPGNLSIAQVTNFTPAGEAADSKADADLGSGGILLLPDLAGQYTHVAVQGGKCGAGSSNSGTSGCMKYLLNRDNLGGQQTGDAGTLYQGNIGGGMWGGPAAYQDASGASYVVYGGGGSTALGSYKVTTSSSGPPTLSLQSSISNVSCLECRNSGSQPIISSNGTTAGSAVVWALQTPSDPASGSPGTITLYAFNASAMGTTLFSAAAGQWTRDSGASYIAGALVSPMVANGKVYVPSDGEVTVFGLSQ